MSPEIPLLAPSGQAAGLFPGRDRGTPADSAYGNGNGGVGVSVNDDGLSFDAGRAHIAVPVIVLAALAGMILLQMGGFRFAFDASVGRSR